MAAWQNLKTIAQLSEGSLFRSEECISGIRQSVQFQRPHQESCIYNPEIIQLRNRVVAVHSNWPSLHGSSM